MMNFMVRNYDKNTKLNLKKEMSNDKNNITERNKADKEITD